MSADQLYIVTIENMVKFYVSTSKEPVTLKSQWNWQKKDASHLEQAIFPQQERVGISDVPIIGQLYEFQ
jgi:hypothetical protein